MFSLYTPYMYYPKSMLRVYWIELALGQLTATL